MLIGNRYRVHKEISRGSFGIIYQGIDQRSYGIDQRSHSIDQGSHSINERSQEKVAIKMELPGSPSSLKYEVKILTYLKTNKIKQVPEIYWFGLYNQTIPCLIMTYYDYSLYEFFSNKPEDCHKGIIHNWIYQIIDILENLHKVFLLHRDIKPQNIMLRGSTLYFIDFGLSTFYIDENRDHIPDFSKEKQDTKLENPIVGSPKFASIFLYQGHRYSRRDDIISVVYLYVYMITGGQSQWFDPDHNIAEQNKQKDTFMTNLYRDYGEPFDWTLFHYFIDYSYQLGYDEMPNYESMKRLFS